MAGAVRGPAAAEGGESSLRPLVVVADDDPLVRELVTRTLGGSGYRVVTGSNGADALELVSRHTPALVILDVMMPGVGGLEATRLLRSTSSTRSLPVLLITAHAGDEEIEAGLRLGADAWLRKPFTAAALREHVDVLCPRPIGSR